MAQFHVVDPMHNFFLGIVSTRLSLLFDKLDTETKKKIEAYCDNIKKNYT